MKPDMGSVARSLSSRLCSDIRPAPGEAVAALRKPLAEARMGEICQRRRLRHRLRTTTRGEMAQAIGGVSALIDHETGHVLQHFVTTGLCVSLSEPSRGQQIVGPPPKSLRSCSGMPSSWQIATTGRGRASASPGRQVALR